MKNPRAGEIRESNRIKVGAVQKNLPAKKRIKSTLKVNNVAIRIPRKGVGVVVVGGEGREGGGGGGGCARQSAFTLPSAEHGGVCLLTAFVLALKRQKAIIQGVSH